MKCIARKICYITFSKHSCVDKTDVKIRNLKIFMHDGENEILMESSSVTVIKRRQAPERIFPRQEE